LKVYRTNILGVEVEVLEFEDNVDTVEEASRLSGEPPERIAKTLLIRLGEGYGVAIVRGDRAVDFEKLSEYVGVNTSMAKAREVREVLGVEPGAVTPIDERVKKFPVYMDSSILDLEYVLCGGGSRKRLFKVYVDDLVRFLDPVILDEPFAELR